VCTYCSKTSLKIPIKSSNIEDEQTMQ